MKVVIWAIAILYRSLLLGSILVSITPFLHQQQATSTWWCGPLPCSGEGRNGWSIPRAFLPWTTLVVFYPCCRMRGHIWTAFLNPFVRTSISTFILTTPLSSVFHTKPLLYLSHSPLSLILMFLIISGDIHSNPGPIDPCSVCSRRVTWGNRSVQCINCSLWVHLSCSGLPLTFVKFPRDTLGLPQCVHLPLNSPLPLTSQPCTLIHKHSKFPILTNTHKTTSSKMSPHPTNLSNHPQLIFNYPRSTSTIPPPQTQHTISPLTQSSFHPSRNNLRILQWNSNGIPPRRTELTHFLSLKINTISSSYKSRSSLLTPLSAYPATKPSKRIDL